MIGANFFDFAAAHMQIVTTRIGSRAGQFQIIGSALWRDESGEAEVKAVVTAIYTGIQHVLRGIRGGIQLRMDIGANFVLERIDEIHAAGLQFHFIDVDIAGG